MTQLLYTDHYLRYNVTYEILGKRAFSSNRNYGDLSGHTVIIITDDMAETTFIRNMEKRTSRSSGNGGEI